MSAKLSWLRFLPKWIPTNQETENHQTPNKNTKPLALFPPYQERGTSKEWNFCLDHEKTREKDQRKSQKEKLKIKEVWEKIKRGRDVNNYMWGFWECSWIALPIFQISLLQLFSSSLPLFHLLRAWTVELVSFPSCLQILTSLSKHFLYFKNKIYGKNTLVEPVGIDFRFLRMTYTKLLAPLWICFGNINSDQKMSRVHVRIIRLLRYQPDT